MATDTREELIYKYGLFINQEKPWGFFVGLSDYIEYILSNKILKKFVDKEWEKRTSEYNKLDEYEKTSIAELEVAKNKLIKIIKDNKIDPSDFVQHLSYIPLPAPDGKKENVFDQIEAFEKGEMMLGGFHSDNLEHFLFDIAANLLELGYANELKEFIVSNLFYKEYYTEINGRDTDMPVVGNKYGNFIFSKTWPKRFKQSKHIELQRKMDSWGSFETIITISHAREMIVKNISFENFTEFALLHKEYPLNNNYNVYLAYTDIKALMENETLNDNSVRILKVESLKPVVAKIQNTLLQSINIRSKSLTKALETKKNEIINPNTIIDILERLEKMELFIEEVRLSKENKEFEQQEALGGKWWKDAKPIYENGFIVLANKKCKILNGAKNQRAICEKLFSKHIGDWLQEYEVKHKFKDTESQRSFYDTGIKLKQKIEKDLKVIGMFEVTMSRIRINNKLFL